MNKKIRTDAYSAHSLASNLWWRVSTTLWLFSAAA